MGRWLAAALVAGVVLACDGRASAQSQPQLAAFALLGVDAVRIGNGARVQPGAVGATAGNVRLAAGAEVSGAIVADSVRLARRAKAGRLFCALVVGGGSGAGVVGGPVVGGSPAPSCQAVTRPVVDPSALAPLALAPGDAAVRVPAHTGGAPVPGGAYGTVTVGRGALLQLAGGTYAMRSIRLAARARLVCLEECRIVVAGSLHLGAAAQLGAVQGLDASHVRIDVAGAGVAFRAGASAVVAATIVAPGGAVRLGRHGEYRGAFLGRSVAVGAGSRVREDSAFPPPRSRWRVPGAPSPSTRRCMST